MSERAEIKRDGARAQKNSGRGQYQKGDAIMGPLLVDYKEASKSFTLNKEVWAKICTDTFKVSRELHPALKIIIGQDNSKVRLAIVEWAYLENLLDELQSWRDKDALHAEMLAKDLQERAKKFREEQEAISREFG